jgi:hypothetical protein
MMSFGRTDDGYTNELLFLDLTRMAWRQVRLGVCCALFLAVGSVLNADGTTENKLTSILNFVELCLSVFGFL